MKNKKPVKTGCPQLVFPPAQMPTHLGIFLLAKFSCCKYG